MRIRPPRLRLLPKSLLICNRNLMILSLVQSPHINKHLISAPEISNLPRNFSLHPITKVHRSQLENMRSVQGTYHGLVNSTYFARINYQRSEFLRCTRDNCIRSALCSSSESDSLNSSARMGRTWIVRPRARTMVNRATSMPFSAWGRR
jgi:hypothetical protein